MVIFAGKFIHGATLELQCRVLLRPWVKKNIITNCLKGRAYASASPFPVRYSPKKSSKNKEFLQTSSPPMKGSENKDLPRGSDPNVLRVEFSDGGRSLQGSFVLYEKSQKKKNQNQTPSNKLIFGAKSEVEEEINPKYGFEDYEFKKGPVEPVAQLGIHQGKDAREQLGFQAGKSKQDAEKMAIELLAARAFTAVELKKKLLGKSYPNDIVNQVITDFQSRGFINDCLYAEAFSRSRWSSSSWGPRLIKQALFKKGVSEVDAEKAIKLVFEDGESGGDHESRLGLSKLSMDHLFVQASKQWLRGRDVSSDKRKSRIIGWLQYRGFNWGVISFVLKKLESEYPP